MKIHYTLAVLAALLCATISYGQTEAGSIYIGGGSNLNFGSSTTSLENGSEIKNTSFNITPTIQYFIVDNLAIGLRMPYSFSQTKQETTVADTKNTFSNLGISPSLRYLIGDNNIKPYVHGDIGYTKQYARYNINGQVNKGESNYTVLNLGGGIAYFFKENLALDLGLFYNYMSQVNTEYSSAGVTLNLGLSLKLR